MNRRPKSWKNPYSKESDPLHMGNLEPNYTDYEDGADAILEVLKKKAKWNTLRHIWELPPEIFD